MRKLIVLIVLLAAGTAAAWVMAGRAAGPVIDIVGPDVIGQSGELIALIDAPGGALTQVQVVLEQGDRINTVLSATGDALDQLAREGENRVRLSQPIGKQRLPELTEGAARITITAARPVLFGYREVEASASRDIEVRLTPPRIAVLSLHHYINHGGSEMVVYRVTPPEAASGVRVGDHEYPGFPAAGAGIPGDPALRVAFFALLWNQPLDTPITVYARDEVGNQSSGTFDYRVFPKTFRESRIQLDDRFLSRVVPAILQNTTELSVDDPSDLLASYLAINGDLRRINNAMIAALAEESAPELLWSGPFKQLVNTAVEAGFADQRTYVYDGRDVDHQVHLGFDLASTAAAPVLAANSGRVIHAGWLGIYGNAVILDHGMGLQSLYAHLSSIQVSVGDMVRMEEQLGRTGATGLAGGDHLHFTMLLGGNAVTPIDWWSSQWIEDRIMRKLREAGAP